jgi:hypothetical protein
MEMPVKNGVFEWEGKYVNNNLIIIYHKQQLIIGHHLNYAYK